MEQIKVRIKTGYFVTVGSGLLSRCGETVRAACSGDSVMIVTDSNVAPLYLATVQDSLNRAGFCTQTFVLAAGERSKTMTSLAELLEEMAEAGLTRTDCVAALGGGIVGDLAGFAAGCYMRGIAFVQLPTTLLAAVDASVGGKTAVDLRAGKNLAGLFHQPKAVCIDTDCMKTLPKEIVADGIAEAIKTAVLSDADLLNCLEAEEISKRYEELIVRCVRYKAGVVERDEKEQGERKLLNLGHTVGHAIERCSDYRIRHGYAVAAGLAVITGYAAAIGKMEEQTARRILAVLQRYGLPTKTEFSAEQLAEVCAVDKKRSGDIVSIIVPYEIGSCGIESVPVKQLKEIIRQGQEAVQWISESIRQD